MSAASLPGSRVAALAQVELLLLRRGGALASTVGLTVVWASIIRLSPADVRDQLLAWALFTDIAALGFLFAPALTLSENTEGIRAAHAVTPVKPRQLVAVRAGVLALLSVAAASALAIATWTVPGALILGTALTSLVFTLLAMVLVRSCETFTAYMLRVPLVAVPLLVPAFVWQLGLSTGWVPLLSPAAAGLALMTGSGSIGLALWMLAWVIGLAVSPRVFTGASAVGTRRPREAASHTSAESLPSLYATRLALWSFVNADRKGLLRDPLFALIIGSVPVTAIAMRFAIGLGSGWVLTNFDIDLETYRPLIWALLLVVHTPVMIGMVTGMLIVEDREAGLLPAVAVTRASLQGLIAYRVAAGVVLTAASLLLAIPMAGVSHPGGPLALGAVAVAGGVLTPLPAMLIATVAADRVAGVAAAKALALPLYLPVVVWFLPGREAWILHLVPSVWPVESLWASTAPEAWGFALITVVSVGALTGALFQRTTRLATPRASGPWQM